MYPVVLVQCRQDTISAAKIPAWHRVVITERKHWRRLRRGVEIILYSLPLLFHRKYCLDYEPLCAPCPAIYVSTFKGLGNVKAQYTLIEKEGKSVTFPDVESVCVY